MESVDLEVGEPNRRDTLRLLTADGRRGIIAWGKAHSVRTVAFCSSLGLNPECAERVSSVECEVLSLKGKGILSGRC